MSLSKDFQILAKLGEGAYSTVFKVLRFEDNNVYALKKVKLFNLSQKQKQNALNQIRILASIENEHIIGYKQAFFDEESKSLCTVMEFANNGDLLRKINQKIKTGTTFEQDEIWKFLISIVQGLKCLHSHKILHRDIKTANIFLQDDVAKLGDLNVSKISQEGLCITQTGTPYYASPQVWKDQPYNEKSDIWSLGCILYEMICLKPPFFSEDLEDLYKKVSRGIYSKIPSSYSADLASLIRLLLQVNPDQRPSCQKILELKFVKKRLIENDENAKCGNEIQQKLLKTIRPSQNFTSLNNQLPKSKYEIPIERKGIKSTISSEPQEQIKEYWSKTKQSLKLIAELEQLPVLSNERKMTPMENSQRNLINQKNSHSILPSRSRKKSEIEIVERPGKKNLDSQRGSLKQQILELRLPKVYNRTRKNSEKVVSGVGISSHSKSLRTYKIFN